MANQPRPSAIHVLDGPGDQAYDEETFQYFLGLEQARSARSGQPLRLLLTSLERIQGRPASFPTSAAMRLFEGLRHALRDTDVVGWYEQDTVAAAVLTPLGDAATPDQVAHLERRVTEGLRRRLPSNLASRLKVKVVERHGAIHGAMARQRGMA